MATITQDTSSLEEYYQKLQSENDILKDILSGATLTVSAISFGENKTNEIFLSNLLKKQFPSTDGTTATKRDTTTVDRCCLSSPSVNETERRNEDNAITTMSITTTDSTSNNDNKDCSSLDHGSRKDHEVPRYYKQDLLSILQERNEIKEERDNLIEELEEWKRAAIESQELVNKLETDLAIAQGKLGGYAYATEIEANVVGILPKGTEFRPKVMTEVMDVYVTDVERVGYREQNGKFVFSIQISWSNKRRFEIYRGYGEFFTFQNTLLLLFPEEAGKHKSERIIPSLPTADNVLAILGATSKKSIVESRLQRISDYCTDVLINLPKKVSRSMFVKDFFKAKPGDTQLDSLERPKQHNLELSVYPLTPEGQSLGVYVAVSDFTPSAKSVNQIALKGGDTVRVAKEDKSGWWFVYNEDKSGYVPASFLKKPGDSDLSSPIETRDILGFIGSLDHKGSLETESQSTETHSHTTPIVPMYEYVAIDSYETVDSRQLCFPEGAVLTIIEKSEDGWWFATYNDNGGWVPSTYLVSKSQYDNSEFNDSIIVDQSLTSTLFVGQLYVTVQSYTAQDEDELSLPVGVTVAVTEKSLTGWWRVKYKKKTGYVPAVILRAAPTEEVPVDSSSPTHVSLSHSVSGIRKPPPRRKQLLETIAIDRRRSTTLMEPVEEIEEPEQVATASNDDHRKQSIMEWFQKNLRRKTMSEDQSKATPSTRSNTLTRPLATNSGVDREEEDKRHYTFSVTEKYESRRRSAHIVGSKDYGRNDLEDSLTIQLLQS